MTANDIFSELQTINQKIKELKSARAVAFEKFKKEFVICMTKCEKLFEDLETDIDFSTSYREDRLMKIASDGKNLTLTFGYSFRNEWNEYEVSFPARYMQDNGQELMELEAAKLTKSKNEAQTIEDLRALEQERSEFARLQVKFGETNSSPV